MARALFVVVGATPKAFARERVVRLFTDEGFPLAGLGLLRAPCKAMHDYALRGDAPADGDLASHRVPAYQNAEIFAGMLIGAGTTPDGMCAWLDGDWYGARFDDLDARVLATPAPVGWVHYVDLVGRAIWVLGDGIPRRATDAVGHGPHVLGSNSDDTARRVDTAQRIHTRVALRAVERAGFTLNPKEACPLVAVAAR